MAKKNFYAVKEGFKKGIFTTWDECKAQVNGYKGAKYKGFETLDEAKMFLGDEFSLKGKIEISYKSEKKDKIGYNVEPIKSKANIKVSKTYINPSELKGKFEYIAFIDGSYNRIQKIYGSGVIVLDEDLVQYKSFYRAGYDKWDQWNIVGELEAAKLSLEIAREKGMKNVAIYHDLKNISLWAAGEWKAKNEYTQEYVKFIEDYSKVLNIYFIKVKAHSTESIYNDLADEAAKKAIEEYLKEEKN